MKIHVNGFDLAYEVIGQTGQAIVLIHGSALNRTIWRTVATKYLGNHRVILLDLRGHGESDAPPGDYLMSQMAEDVARLLEFLEISKAVICGHSMGGYVVLSFAELFPGRLSGLGLITTRASADSEEKRSGRYQMAEQVRQQGSRALAESLAPRLSNHGDIIQAASDMIANTNPQGTIGSTIGMAKRPDYWDLLPEIDVPALVVAGEEDQVINVADSRKMAETLPDGQFLSIPGAGHMPMLEKPELLGEGLVSLLNRVGD
jgi:pimeloyl-ACP methyl ester carboxylesterase